MSTADPRPVFGRERELGLLSEVMRPAGLRVIHVHGVSGIGKSALVAEFAAIGRSRKRTVPLLDGRTIEPTESGFQLELSRQLRITRPALGSIVRVLSKRKSAVVIVVDSYELLGLLDAWLRRSFVAARKKCSPGPGKPLRTRAAVDRVARMAGIVPRA